MRIPITGSKVHRVWKCPPSAILPQVVGDSSKHEPARRRGEDIHRFLEHVKTIGVDAALAEAPEDLRPLLLALDLEDLPVDLATEVAFAWNWRASTARLLVGVFDRHYELADPPLSDDEIGCTLDVVGVQPMIDPPDHVEMAPVRGYVGDYKSGHGKYPAPDMFGQLLLGALCVRSVYGCDDVVLELIHIHDDGTNHKPRRTVNEWDLDAFAADLKAAMELVEHWEGEHAAGRAVAAHEGPWCQHCDAFKSCPAKFALVRSIPAELMAMGVEVIRGIDTLGQQTQSLELRPGILIASQPERLAEAWMMKERIVEVLNRIGNEICSIAAHQEITLPDGRVIGLLRTERRDLDGRITHQLLEKRYGRETADAAVQLESSFSAVHQAVAKHIRPGEKFKTRAKDGVEDKIVAELERLGGIGMNTTESVKPHVPKKKRLPAG